MLPSKLPGTMQLRGETIVFDGSPEGDVEAPDAESPPSKKAKKKKRFSMHAYTGKPMDYFGLKIAYALDGMSFASATPILQQHNHEKIVALSDKARIDQTGLHFEGTMYDTAAANEVHSLASSDPPFPWQASMGVQNIDAQFIDEGENCDVNNYKLEGPAIVVWKSRVKESSFVPLGADDSTRSLVFADDTSGAVTLRRCSMSDTKAAPDPLIVERKRIADITAAFPKDASFANKHIGLGSSVLEAKAAYAEELEKKVAALEARPQNDPIPGRTTGNDAGGAQQDAMSSWEQAVHDETQLLTRSGFAGDMKFEAIRRADRKNPGLRQRYLEQYNSVEQPRQNMARLRVQRGQ